MRMEVVWCSRRVARISTKSKVSSPPATRPSMKFVRVSARGPEGKLGRADRAVRVVLPKPKTKPKPKTPAKPKPERQGQVGGARSGLG